MHPGTVVAGRFRVHALMGRGGMGAVYRGQDLHTGDAVAVKVIDRELVGADDRRRFLREGNLLERLSHPAIVRHAGHGAMDDGRLFVAMEWLDGGDLYTRLEQGSLSLDDALTLATRLCEGLAAVHDAGIVHRDIKPSNVMLPGGEVARAKLVDFGVAQAATLHSGKLTKTGAIIGTPGYLAPEQVQGGAVDARADLYTLGLLLYECLTGTPPFAGDNLMALFGRVLFDPLPPLRSARPALPAELEALIASLAEKSREARPASARAVLATLASIPRAASSGGKPSPVRTPSRLEQPVVVVVAGAGNDRTVRTLSSAEAAEALADLHALARQHGGSVRFLPQGGVLAAVEREGETAAEQVLKATRLARQLCAWRPDWAFAVVTGRGVLEGERAYGEAFDRVARVLEAGEPGQAIIDSVTGGLLRGRCDLTHKPGDLFLLGAEHEQPEQGARLLGKPSPFVGRARELSLLLATLDECAEEEAARVVLVLADPGLGKSRLAAELRAQAVAARGEGLLLLHVRCDPMRSGSAYAALASALARAAGFAPDEAPATRREKLAAHLARSYAPEPVPSAVCAFMGELLDTPFEVEFEPQLAPARSDPALMADQVQRAFAAWVAHSAREPRLIVVDDMHWMDGASVRLLDAALTSARAAPLCVLCLARPALRARFPSLFESQALTELSLSRLSRKAGVLLAEAMLSRASTPQRIDQLVERADGNVFFLEELIRFAIDRAGDALPDSVLAMVEARFERLDPDGRLLLRAASVFGETFTAAALEALVGAGMRLSIDVEGWLATLCSMEILTLQRASALGDTDRERYGFRHALLREACYAAWTEVDRAHAHAHAAEYLEHEGEHDPTVLAEHWERGDVPARAAVHYLEAAKRALRSNDLEGAIRCAERGRAGAEGPALAGELELLASEARVWRGEPERAKSGALAALALLPHDHQARAQATATLAEAAALSGGWQSEGRQELALYVQRMLDAAPLDPEPQERWLSAVARASFAAVIGQAPVLATLALGSIDDVIETRRTTGHAGLGPLVRAHIAHARAAEAMQRRDRQTAAERYAEAAEAFCEAGALRQEAGARANVAAMYLELGDHARAEPVIMRAITTAEAARAPYALHLARFNRGLVAAAARDWERAEALIRESIEAFIAQGDRRLAASARCAFAELRLARGDAAGARVEAEAARAAAEGLGGSEAGACGVLSLVLWQAGERDTAAHWAREGMRLRDRQPLEERDELLRQMYALALEHGGDAAGALATRAALESDLQASAALIRDPMLRETYTALARALGRHAL